MCAQEIIERLRDEVAELKERLHRAECMRDFYAKRLESAEYMQRVTDEMSCSLQNIAKAAQ